MSVPSVTIAKDRLRNLLITDRIQCTPDMIEFLTSDLYQTISKYIEISPEQFDVKIRFYSIFKELLHILLRKKQINSAIIIY